MTPDNPIWVEFARSMAAMVAPAAQGIAQLLASDPPVVFWISPPVTDYSELRWRKNFLRRTSSLWIGRRFWRLRRRMPAKPESSAVVHTVPGNAFEVDYGNGYDVVLVTNFSITSIRRHVSG